MDSLSSSSTDPETLTDTDVVLTLKLQAVGKLQLACVGDSIYKRGSDGTWYRLAGLAS
jgi:hypothetical protein